ncbi:hypothetical protein GH714_022286 [Hevea brasiliensis]|uniref:Helicase ATP-binding domain-containing protein n=1 Tax=Hevea brasiliensis TaxID=3981 RepID=A0A6A6N016_HEVBR|nr:hypothetical protein GH714_022286 [Hevea brasiliensis]
MTSASPLQIADDDDGFDWEAAVKEIDVACQSANPLTSLPNYPSSSHFVPLQNNLVDDPDQQVAVDGEDERVSCVGIDVEAAKTWIYPVNVPLREYQLAITKTALFSNTLVALPTGLGKTLIAAVVMYNYFRWFPDGKIVFAAPSRPLVMQQIEACHNIVGIPQEWTIDMTGQLSPTKRACFWKTKRVFFVTPQVLEKDIQAGTCLVKYLVCLVIDEAHRALGNYSYCVAVRELMTVPLQLRILALTATPGSKQQAIQNIISNLHISTLEYRDENDPDVSPYVHNRKIELLEVALGKDAVDINKQLLEVIRPYAARLSAVGLLQNRDYKTFSPPDLLNSRDKFRRAPPPELPQGKYGEIEAYFGGLITLYHIRKLLSSHGIRPAYEMLEEKLKQGPFARLMTKNEDIRKVKLSMQQSLSHGAPSPKLSKMLEVLVDHFKTNDPQNSRVIIFSNFRGSVRDIMDALSNIGDLVKATEFIGQSTGKALKGQSQKVQQAVLECFFAKLYLDKVLLVLACEGSELKGYMRKQANSRAIRKHMHNGGINSFDFHSSPRMIPHVFKPEVQFVKLSIEQYIPRGKKVKDDSAIQTPMFRAKLNADEVALIAKYFEPTSEKSWRPSLIAFPHFQAFPSRVHKVMHSYRTDMLIDTMQYLQNLSFSGESNTFFTEGEIASGKCLGVDTVEKEDNDKDPLIWDESPSTKSQKTVTDSEVSSLKSLRTKEQNVLDPQGQRPAGHSYLFGSEFVSVDAHGKVIILSVPVLPLKEASQTNCTSPSATVLLNCLKPNSCHLKNPGKNYEEQTVQGKSSQDIITSWVQCETSVALAMSKSNLQQETTLDQVEKFPETSVLKKIISNEGDCVGEALNCLEIKVPSLHADEYDNSNELSPRLTNMIQSGFVPESPIDIGLLNGKGRNEFLATDVSPMKLCAELLSKSQSPRKNDIAISSSSCQRDVSISSINNEFHTPILKENNVVRTDGCTSISPAAEETNTPLANLTKNSLSKDWLPSSGDKSENVEQARKFKRLRKIGDVDRNRNPEGNKDKSLAPIANLGRSFSDISPNQIKYCKGKRKLTGNARTFIEEEAEVSSEAEMSDDEKDDSGNSSYDDSFIDDRTNPTAASIQAETSRVDMMAVYRRSLLTQSPIERESNSYITSTPDCGNSVSRRNESKSSSVKTLCSFQTPQPDSANDSARRDTDSFRTTERMSAAMPSITDAGRKETFQQGPAENLDANAEVFHDDQFFEDLDLDAVEAQATLLLKHRSKLSVQKQDVAPKSDAQNFDLQSSPSFDLGIW